jgi:hypothetical protein
MTLEYNEKVRPPPDRENAFAGRVAEGTGLASNLLLWMPLGLQGIYDLLDL